jgi:hypothetical protein
MQPPVVPREKTIDEILLGAALTGAATTLGVACFAAGASSVVVGAYYAYKGANAAATWGREKFDQWNK